MTEEITNLLKWLTWDLIQKYEVPEGAKMIPGTWDFKYKHFPDGSFQQFKAWFCVRWDIQKRLNDVPMNTYAPVVQRSTVRLMLVLTFVMGLNNQSTNFSNTFAQADINQPMYLQPPAKYSDAFIRLSKISYGQVESHRLWYEKLKEGLEKHIFTPSNVDPWMFISKTTICVKYVDDCLWFYLKQK